MSANASCVTQAAIDVHLAAIFVSLELSRSRWMMTSLSPGKGEKMSKRSVEGGDVVGVGDHQLDAREAALGQAPGERAPKGLGLGGADVQPDDLPPPLGVAGHGDYRGDGDDAPALALVQVDPMGRWMAAG